MGSTSKARGKGQEGRSEVSSEESQGSKVSSSSEESQSASTDDLRIGTFQYTSDKSRFTIIYTRKRWQVGNHLVWIPL